MKNNKELLGVHIERLKTAKELGDIDGLGVSSCFSEALSFAALSKMKLPGRELLEGTLWKVDEKQLITEEELLH